MSGASTINTLGTAAIRGAIDGGDPLIQYVGECMPADYLSPDQPKWRIRAIRDNGDNTTDVAYAISGGKVKTGFDLVWDDRESYNYFS